MKQLIIILIAPIILFSCRTAKHTAIKDSQKDSIRVEYRERTILVPDTVFVEIPSQRAERTTKEKISHLENDYAYSDAKINPDGTLTHTLDSKQQSKPIAINKTIEYRDSIIYKDKVINETVTEYIEHKLSWWQQTQIYGFWGVAALLAVVLLSVYRKKIIKLVIGLWL